MLNQGVSEEEVYDRLQARVPGFSLSPDPGGNWNWLIGLIVFVVASATLLLLARSAVAKRGSVVAANTDDDVDKAKDYDDEQHWQDRLDDELLDSDL